MLLMNLPSFVQQYWSISNKSYCRLIFALTRALTSRTREHSRPCFALLVFIEVLLNNTWKLQLLEVEGRDGRTGRCEVERNWLIKKDAEKQTKTEMLKNNQNHER